MSNYYFHGVTIMERRNCDFARPSTCYKYGYPAADSWASKASNGVLKSL